ncbi:hypothetical protein JW868_04235 [Candidatus Woesearchaeota archaeon]|nr:hypothetical protein [Candidatus Woesearchaeota archaeon]
MYNQYFTPFIDHYLAPNERYFTPMHGPPGEPMGKIGVEPTEEEAQALEARREKIEEPIVPMNELGTTVVEKDPVTGGNIIQNTAAAIKQGAGNIQLVFNVSSEQPIGGRAKSYGKEVRKALREMTEASGVVVDGVEMPTSSITNLSGFNPQQGTIMEEKRDRDVKEVRDAIHFVADVAGGGGVDIWSQEFARTIYDAPFNQKGKDKNMFHGFEGEEQHAIKYLVDDRTGQTISAIRTSTIVTEPMWERAQKDGQSPSGKTIKEGDFLDSAGEPLKFVDENGRQVDEETFSENLLLRKPKWDEKTQSFKTRELDWGELKQLAADYNKQMGLNLSAEEWAYRLQLENRLTQSRGHSLFYSRQYEAEKKEFEALMGAEKYFEKMKRENPERYHSENFEIEDELKGTYGATRQTMNIISAYKTATGGYEKLDPLDAIGRRKREILHQLKHTHEASASADAQARQTLIDMRHVKTLADYAKEKSFESYGMLGIEAMKESKKNPNVKKDLYVGPEIGWPQAWGGHPDEWIELIKGGRQKMIDLLTKPEIELMKEGRKVKEKNPYYNSQISQEDAKNMAKKHIKGLLDTSHLGMWYNNMRREHPHETEEQRKARFNKWYMQVIDRIAQENKKDEIVGGIQAVDSATGAHGHLPPGQGMLPVVEAVDKLRAEGKFKGFIVSEGHEEEAFGRGRILTETWRAFGANLGTNPMQSMQPMRWNNVMHGHLGYGAPPFYIVGAYSPSNDWQLWSEVPLE